MSDNYGAQEREWQTELARQKVISAAASWIASHMFQHYEDRDPGPNDGDEMDYKRDGLDDAVRKLAKLLGEQT